MALPIAGEVHGRAALPRQSRHAVHLIGIRDAAVIFAPQRASSVTAPSLATTLPSTLRLRQSIRPGRSRLVTSCRRRLWTSALQVADIHVKIDCAARMEFLMPVQIVMDRTGDTRHTFDAGDRAAVEKAEKRFMELTGAGFVAAVRSGPGEQRTIRSFDAGAEETLFHPRLVGG
jgi:hypothetical protein